MGKKILSYSFFAIVLILFLYSFLSRVWVAEDAYITFRHIQNLFAGNGLTFNAGMRIEGFTHPLWVILLIGLVSFGIPIHFASLLLNVFFTIAGMGILFYHFVFKKNESWYQSILIIPFFFIIHDGFRDFWTSGMEFSLTFFLISLFMSQIANRELRNPVRNSILLSLLYLTRPELGIFFIYYGFWYWIQKNNHNSIILNWKHAFLYLLLFLLIAGGYHIFRWFYYHDLFPTTFYAKSSELMWKEGFLYIWHTIKNSPLLLPTIIFVIILIFIKKYTNKYFFRDMGAVFIHVFYIISIGGDFMAYRFLLPDLTILYIYFFIILNQWIQNKSIVMIMNISLFLISIYYLFQKKIHTPVAENLIVHEYRAYENKHLPWKDRWFRVEHKWYKRGEVFKKLQKCLDYRPFVITNSWLDAQCAPKDDYGLGYFGYASGPDVLIIDQLGITDKQVALTGKTIWKRVGHTKSISIENVIKRNITFCSLNHKEYDSIMGTHFFPVIRFDLEFLYRLGSSYSERIRKLKKLYKKIKNSVDPVDRELYRYLLLIEKNYKIQILQLPENNPPQYYQYDSCWKYQMDFLPTPVYK